MTYFPARNTYLGASDVAGALNLSPYSDAPAVWREKTGRAGDPEESGPMKRGKDIEQLIIDLAIEQYRMHVGKQQAEYTIDDVDLSEDRFIPIPKGFGRGWLRCHIDGVIENPGRLDPPADGPGSLEVKSPGSNMLRSYIENGLPRDYILQKQTTLFLTGFKWGRYCFLDYDSWTVHAFDVKRDDKLIASMVPALVTFWEMVLADVEPPYDEQPPVIPDHVPGECVRINDIELEEFCDEYAHAVKTYKELEKKVALMKGKIKEIAGEDSTLAEINSILRVSHKWTPAKPKPNAVAMSLWIHTMVAAYLNDDRERAGAMARAFMNDGDGLFIDPGKPSRRLLVTGIGDFKGTF